MHGMEDNHNFIPIISAPALSIVFADAGLRLVLNQCIAQDIPHPLRIRQDSLGGNVSCTYHLLCA